MKILRDFSELRKDYNVKDVKFYERRLGMKGKARERVESFEVFKNLEFPEESCVRSTKL